MDTKSTIKVAYITYPYTGDPKGNAERVRIIAQEIIAHRKDVVLIVPHWAFDALMGFPTGYNNTFFARWELEIISRCDFIIQPKVKLTCGVIWETEFAIRLGIPIYSPSQVIARKDLEDE